MRMRCRRHGRPRRPVLSTTMPCPTSDCYRVGRGWFDGWVHTEHRFATRLDWTGSTGVGYEHYDRSHRLTASPAEQTLVLAADPAFLGDPALLNPEQLLLAAASSCQFLSFLAVSARSRIDVIGYTDAATAVMPEDLPPTRITAITLNPVITLADTDRPRPDEVRLRRMVDLAHKGCFIANSLNSTITVQPRFRWAD